MIDGLWPGPFWGSQRMAMSNILQRPMQTNLQGHYTSHQVQSWTSIYPNILPALVPLAYIHSGASTHPDAFLAYILPTHM